MDEQVVETGEQIHCAGCGKAIQTEDPTKPGYTPRSALAREVVVCQRCFRIKHYNEVAPVAMDDDDFLRILNGIGATDSLVVMVVDLFDFQGSWLRGLPRFVGKNPILLVGNKVDLLPRNINLNRVRNWMQHEAKDRGLKPADVVLVSAQKGIGIDELLSRIGRLREKRDVYIVGVTNVGKSTLINRILHDYGSAEMEITTSPFPGTTLDKIEIPLEDGRFLYDTPGIINRDQIGHMVTPQDLRKLTPSARINPKVYQLNDKQTLFLAGLARVDFVRGEHQPFVVYVANNLYIHRTKLEQADDIFARHHGELLAPPTGEAVKQLPPFTKHSLKIGANGPTDIVISGLGWISLQGKYPAVVDVHVPKGVGIAVRKALV
ncbi:ribosome biogenesis GTPase YqeH [Brevibacillus sp. SYP-B805]|uniref:ribosome biogenesis GTPase YqeH n=1 Tax=Brevibacillus sp. SYP-B805 TaxID=1578199 RepID=UPI0013EDDA20|nr:ribosome biogenesis GTPase YqeH [Brevibacillus sp. SYP-B805]NGQ94180.1 ribosome biogenesis GTPase YqeH [Brevibacillus sp. SYP-B805]